MKTFKYKGYTLEQLETKNHHYTIYNKEGRRVMHVPYKGLIFSQREAQKCIDFYLYISRRERARNGKE